MSRGRDLDAVLRRARPPDPGAADAETAAVRTLARFAILEAGWASAPARARPPHRRVRAAAVLVALLLPLAALGVERDAEAPVRDARPAAAALAARVARALAGDDLARQRLVRGGLRARRALLVAAEAGDARGAAALALLRSAGPLRDAGEARRVARLAYDPRLRAQACALLARALGREGPRRLARLLADYGEAEAAAAAALEAVAAGGRREAALAGLLAGVRRARPAAAAAAIRVAGSAHLARVLAALPDDPRVRRATVKALRGSARTVRARLVRLAARGERRALELACAAGAAGIVPVLERETRHADPARGRVAVDLLATLRSEGAWLALARVHEAGGDARAAVHLAVAPPEIDAVLERHARQARHGAPAALAALAVRGRVEALVALADIPRLAPAALDALAAADVPEASARLAALAGRAAHSAQAVAALAERAVAGRREAGEALLALARRGHARLVMRTLARSGAAGVRWLRAAAADPQLARRARRALERLPGAGRAQHAAAPRKPKTRTLEARSI